MEHVWSSMKGAINRRSFVKNGLTAAGVATVGAGLLADSSSLLAREGPEEHSGRLTPGDAALLRFAAAAEILETDFWVQYNELGDPRQRSSRWQRESSLHCRSCGAGRRYGPVRPRQYRR